MGRKLSHAETSEDRAGFGHMTDDIVGEMRKLISEMKSEETDRKLERIDARITAIETQLKSSKNREWKAAIEQDIIDLKRQVGVHQTCFGSMGGFLANIDGAMKPGR
jgi:phage shock protein A